MNTTNILLEQAQGVQETAVELTIRTVSGNCHNVIAFSSWSVHGVKEIISGVTNHSVNEQRLLFGTRVLSDTEILLEFLPSNETHHEMLLVISIDEEQADIITSLVLGRIGLRNVDRKYQENFSVVEAAVRQDGMNLEHAQGAARKDKTIVLAAVVQNGFALSFAPREFSSDPDVVLVAVRSNAFSITLANQSLQTDCDFAIKAVHANPFVCDYLERCVLDNVEFRGAFPNASKRPTSADHSMVLQELAAAGRGTITPPSSLCHEAKKAAASKKCNLLSLLCDFISTRRLEHKAMRSDMR